MCENIKKDFKGKKKIMKIKDLIELMGVYESVRILDTQYNEIVRCVAVELPEELSEKFVGNICASGGSINIVALDKPKRRWYNNKEKYCGVAKR